MKKIVNGKKYDTETAKFCGYQENMYDSGNFYWNAETLYRKKTGDFFLYGESGPAGKYSVSCGLNSWSGGKAIVPLAEKEARKWAETYLDGEDYEKIFGEVEE